MLTNFGDSLKKLRTDSQMSQQQLADQLFVDRSTITNWELGRRVPDTATIVKIAEIFSVEVSDLIDGDLIEPPYIMMADDERIILTGSVPILKQLLPHADIKGFTSPAEALRHAKKSRVDLAMVDIEMGRISGLELCRQLLEINPKTNVIFLTAFMDYAYDAWSTGACGFIAKPLTAEKLKQALSCLRYPIRGIEAS